MCDVSGLELGGTCNNTRILPWGRLGPAIMVEDTMSYAMQEPFAIEASQAARATFIRRTYGHLAGAILAFVAIELVLFSIPGIENLVGTMIQSQVSWLIVLAAFIGVGFLADVWARSETSRGLQYFGLGLYIVAEAVIFLPLLYIASLMTDRSLIPTAGILTLCMFAGLTLAVFVTGKDFSFLGPILCVAGMLALGLCVALILFAPGGGILGLLFAFFMVALASAAILYQTSNIMYHYRTDQHVAAALGLFASVATMFWYILQILMASSRD
jgi:FtsH-binding integral membrane protein